MSERLTQFIIHFLKPHKAINIFTVSAKDRGHLAFYDSSGSLAFLSCFNHATLRWKFCYLFIFILPRLQPLPDQATIMSELNRITLAVITFRKIKQTAAQINTIWVGVNLILSCTHICPHCVCATAHQFEIATATFSFKARRRRGSLLAS